MAPRKLRMKKPRAGRRLRKAPDPSQLMSLAQNSFEAGDYSRTADYCRRIANGAARLRKDSLVAEAYYLWSLASLKDNNPEAAKKICRRAKRTLGDYPDLAYLEVLIAAMMGKLKEIPAHAQRFLQLRRFGATDAPPWKSRSIENAGRVLLIWGQAAEQMGDTGQAIFVYKKYLASYPEDKIIEMRLAEMTNQSLGNGSTLDKRDGKKEKTYP